MPIFKYSAIVGSTILLLGTIWFGATPATAAVIPEQRIALINGQLAGYLQSRTRVPILLPQHLPPSLNAMPLNLTAQAAASKNNYSVQYWMITHPQGINGAPTSLTANSADTQVFAIRGTRFPTRNAAVSALSKADSPCYQVPAGTKAMHPLIPGFNAAYYPAVHALVWNEGDWTIEIHQGSLASDLSEGRLVDAVLSTYTLPPFPGILVTAPAPHGPSASNYGEAYALAFADGSSVYSVNPFYVQPWKYASPSPVAMDSPGDLVATANSLVPLSAFYTSSVARITLQTNPRTVRAGGYSVISGQLLKSDGHGDPYSPFSLSGLPQTPDFIDGTTNQNGQFFMQFFFPRAGTYTIQANDGQVSNEVRVQVLPSVSSSPGSSVIKLALQAISGHTSLSLNGPLNLTFRRTGYLTARTQATPKSYAVSVIATRRPLAINSPLIPRYLSTDPMIAQFGSMRLTAVQPAPGSPNYLSILAAHNPQVEKIPATSATAYPNLGLGIRGAVYQHGTSAFLDWGEGDWTAEISGGTLAQEEQVSSPVIAYLHRYLLPPYPGIVAVHLVKGTDQALTEIDWMDGHVLSYIIDPTASSQTPVAAASMAVSWHLWRFQKPAQN